MLDLDDLSLEGQLSWLATASTRDINNQARQYNWDAWPEIFLKEVSLRAECNLGTALTIYAMGLPSDHASYNTNGQYDALLAFLSDLRDRINTGHYENDPTDPLVERDRVKWHLDGGMMVKDAPEWVISAKVYEQTLDGAPNT